MTTPHPQPPVGAPASAQAVPPQYAPQQYAAQQQWPAPVPAAAPAAPSNKAHLGHALASEWTKIRSVPSTMWTLGVMFLLVVGVGVLVAVGMNTSSYTGTPLLSGGLFGLLFGQIAIITLGVLVVTSEYGTGMIRTTMTACPQRGRILLAKAMVFFGVSFVTTTLACTLVALVNSALLSDQTPPAFLAGSSQLADSFVNGELVADSGEWLGATVGAGLFVALLGLLSLAVGAMLRHTAGAITAMLGVVLLPLIVSLFLFGERTQTLRENLQGYSPLNGLATLFRVPLQGDADSTGWFLLGLLAAVTAAALVGAYGVMTKRDV